MLAPLSTATSDWPRAPSRSTHVFRPAAASAPAGSMMVRVSSKMSLMAAQTSSLRHADDLVHRLAHDRERQLADLAHGDAVGEDADVIERHTTARRERPIHRVGFVRLDADHLDVGTQRLDVAGNPGDQAAAADRHEHRRQAVLAVAENLGADRALARDDQRVVEGVNERHPALGDERVAVRLRVGVAVAREHDLGAHGAHRVHLDLRRRLRHDDHGVETELARRERDTLRVVAGARGDDAASGLVCPEVRNLVVRAAQLEAEHRLQILALEEDLVAETARQPRREVERRFARDVVDAAREDVVEQPGQTGHWTGSTANSQLPTPTSSKKALGGVWRVSGRLEVALGYRIRRLNSQRPTANARLPGAGKWRLAVGS